MKRPLTNAMVQNPGAAVRVIALLDEVHELCISNGWPHVLSAIAAGEEIVAHCTGGVTLSDPNVLRMVEASGEVGFTLIQMANAGAESHERWTELQQEAEKEPNHVDA